MTLGAERRGPPPQLVVLSGEHRGDVIVLDDAFPVVFGQRCGVRFPDPQLADVHAQVFPAEGRWYLQDFASAAGTWIGAERVDEVHPLDPGRVFRVGGTHLALVQPEPNQPARPEDIEAAEELLRHQTRVTPGPPPPPPPPPPLPPAGAPTPSAAQDAPAPSAPPGRRTRRRAAPSGPVQPGEILGDYDVLQVLGQGPRGTMFKAVDRRRGRPVALKVLAPELTRDTAAVTRFIRGAKTAARLSHPHLVKVLGAGHFGARIYMALEYVDGPTLEAYCQARGGRLEARLAVSLMAGVASALEQMHLRQVVHRDVSPSTVLVGPGPSAKLTDLSLAKRRGESHVGELDITNSDDVLVETVYASPEALFGASRIDHRSDVYSFGATLFRAVTGQPPYRSTRPADVLQGQHVDPRASAPHLSDALVELLCTCLKREPEQRYAGAQALRQALLATPEAR